MDHMGTSAAKNFKILIVDDEEAIHPMMRACIEQAGYNCLTARDGEEGLKVLAIGTNATKGVHNETAI
jgi:CheY-like chemotaxis protein